MLISLSNLATRISILMSRSMRACAADRRGSGMVGLRIEDKIPEIRHKQNSFGTLDDDFVCSE
jgi:hypothetical protein